ncbi:MAG: hypothetical protein Q8R15_02330 [Candidatus Micrarchaeota archaeon]|nr:hypothetical protein [Candidatus Micrarchaeota archaeon]
MEDEEMQNECFEEEIAAINSEMRFLCLELMKISSQRNIPFPQVMHEFIDNTNTMKLALANAENQSEKITKRKTTKVC